MDGWMDGLAGAGGGAVPVLAAAAEVAAGLGLLEMAPAPLYEAGKDIAASLAVDRARVAGGAGYKDVKAAGHALPADVPPAAAAWRLSLWRAARLPDRYLRSINQQTLLVVAVRTRCRLNTSG